MMLWGACMKVFSDSMRGACWPRGPWEKRFLMIHFEEYEAHDRHVGARCVLAHRLDGDTPVRVLSGNEALELF